VRDAEWIAQLLEHGLLTPSFVPPPAVRHLRMLTRYRVQLMGDRTREMVRLVLMLEDASIKLSTVASPLKTVSARAILAAMIDGETDARVLAEMAKGRMRSKIPDFAQALEGHFNTNHATAPSPYAYAQFPHERLRADLGLRPRMSRCQLSGDRNAAQQRGGTTEPIQVRPRSPIGSPDPSPGSPTAEAPGSIPCRSERPGLCCYEGSRRTPQPGDDIAHSGIRQLIVHRRDPTPATLTASPG
jgi:hypothetical protein